MECNRCGNDTDASTMCEACIQSIQQTEVDIAKRSGRRWIEQKTDWFLLYAEYGVAAHVLLDKTLHIWVLQCSDLGFCVENLHAGDARTAIMLAEMKIEEALAQKAARYSKLLHEWVWGVSR
jgi:hypothetical protein